MSFVWVLNESEVMEIFPFRDAAVPGRESELWDVIGNYSLRETLAVQNFVKETVDHDLRRDLRVQAYKKGH